MEFDKEYWDGRYRENDTPWDTGSHHNELPNIIESFDLWNKTGYVPGCGYGYDPAFLARQGITIWAADISFTALEKARTVAEKYSGMVNFLNVDMMNPGERFLGYFDFIFEYTTFCSVAPAEREVFIKSMAALLKKDGLFISVLFPLSGITKHPPFNIPNDELFGIASGYFELYYFQKDLNSIKPRAGRESLHVYRKK
ncbi:MAG: methyltransferase domain-containing protein [Ignavibacteriaceae bacterium]|nr:methyltransferase domain-containing protein [Ignavibacteriaceae bacterium]